MFDEKYSKKFSTGVLITRPFFARCLWVCYEAMRIVAHFGGICAKEGQNEDIMSKDCTFLKICASFFLDKLSR
jgi:hypothetical protein